MSDNPDSDALSSKSKIIVFVYLITNKYKGCSFSGNDNAASVAIVVASDCADSSKDLNRDQVSSLALILSLHACSNGSV